jgi:CelD/BcsL family acetyltransferase involved in cellulose biosynthesis
LRVPEVRIEGAFYACLQDVIAREQVDSAIENCWSRSWFRPARDAELYIAALSNSHHRKEWRRLERRLGESGTISYDELGRQGDVCAWLDDFLSLEAAGWKGRQGSAFASKTSHAAWLKEIGIEAFARGRLMMLSLRRDGVAIAVKLNVLVDAGGYTFKIAYDERLERFSPGLLLELENIRRVHERANVAWMDSLAAPGHPLTERVWSGKAAFASMLIAPGRLVGRVLLAARPLLRLARQVAGVASARRGER